MVKGNSQEINRQVVINLLESFENESNDYHASLERLRSLNRQSTLLILQEMLDHPDAKMRYYASDVLLEIDAPTFLELLLPLLNDPHQDIRYNICTKLCYYGDGRAVDALINLLSNEQSSDVRLMAAVALGRIGDQRAIPSLEYSVTHDFECDFQGEPVSNAAARAIENIRNISEIYCN